MSEENDFKLGALEWEYIPTFQGNDKKETPGKAKLRQLTTREMNQCIKIRSSGPEVNEEKILECGLVELTDFKVNGVEIKTAADLLDTPGLYTLFTDLWVEIQTGNILPEQDSKNS